MFVQELMLPLLPVTNNVTTEASTFELSSNCEQDQGIKTTAEN